MSNFRQYTVISFGESKNISENVNEEFETPVVLGRLETFRRSEESEE